MSSCNFNPASALSSTTEATTPLYDETNIITYVKDGTWFTYLKKVASTTGTFITNISITTLKEKGNVCFFQMIYSSNNYYYSAWIDGDFFINIARLNFSNLNDISTTKSNVKINKGLTIDCKVFESYGDIICVYVDMMDAI